MNICGKQTKSGSLCKNTKGCHLHRENENACSICLSSVRRTRGTRQLSCGHLYHKKCIDQWKDNLKNTCPVCRKNFDLSKYKVTINIENTDTDRVQSISVPYSNIIQLFENFDFEDLPDEIHTAQLQFDVNNLNDLEMLLGDLGIEENTIEELR